MNILAPWRIGSGVGPALKGKKIELRMPELDDFEAWSYLRRESRNFLEPWEPSWDDQELTREAYRARIKRYQQMRRDDIAYAFFVHSDQQLVGAITLSNVRRGIAQMGTLGYWIGERFAGRGLMSDALMTLSAHAFDGLRLHRLEAACLPRNAASVRLLEKSGFVREGYAKAYLKIAGRWEDHLLYGCTNQKPTD